MRELQPNRRIRTDVLVVGGGGAAARAALEAARRGASVRLVSKGRLGAAGLTATAWSEILAIGAALGHSDPRDNPEVHYRDTMAGGEGFCDPALVRVLAEDAPARVMDLVDLGVPFDRDGDRLRQGLSDFATYPRTCRVNGSTAPVILATLLKELRRLGVPMDEGVMAAGLLLADGRAAGVIGLGVESGETILYEAGAVVFATGGVGDAFQPTLSDWTNSGDGLAMALQAGARLINMEFHQYIPGMVYPSVLVLSKPLYGLKPRLLDGSGEEFVPRYLPEGVSMEEAYRHKVSPYTTSNASRYIDEGMYAEICGGRTTEHGAIYYDFTGCSGEQFLAKAPNSYRKLLSLGVDPLKQRVEVSILFQMINGGVLMGGPDATCDLPGLFVAGETAGGVRGPDRPGGNSLCEGQVFGARAGGAAAAWASAQGTVPVAAALVRQKLERLTLPLTRTFGPNGEEIRQGLKRVMWRDCLVVKRAEGLQRALGEIDRLEAALPEVRAGDGRELAVALGAANSLLVSRAIVLSALARTETRASHCREDFPDTDPSWRRSVVVRMERGAMSTELMDYPRAGRGVDWTTVSTKG